MNDSASGNGPSAVQAEMGQIGIAARQASRAMAVTDLRCRPTGIQVGRMRVPLGVIGIIYEWDLCSKTQEAKFAAYLTGLWGGLTAPTPLAVQPRLSPTPTARSCERISENHTPVHLLHKPLCIDNAADA